MPQGRYRDQACCATGRVQRSGLRRYREGTEIRAAVLQRGYQDGLLRYSEGTESRATGRVQRSGLLRYSEGTEIRVAALQGGYKGQACCATGRAPRSGLLRYREGTEIRPAALHRIWITVSLVKVWLQLVYDHCELIAVLSSLFLIVLLMMGPAS